MRIGELERGLFLATPSPQIANHKSQIRNLLASFLRHKRVMVVLEDFTQISEGRDVPDAGQVERCPRCGRSGVEEPSEEGTPLFVHSQVSEVIGDGMRVELQDCCTIPRS